VPALEKPVTLARKTRAASAKVIAQSRRLRLASQEAMRTARVTRAVVEWQRLLLRLGV